MTEKIEMRKKEFLPNSPVVLLDDIKDPYTPLEKGLKGSVRFVDDIGTGSYQMGQWQMSRGLFRG